MVTDNENLMRDAQNSLKGKWPLAVGTFFIYMLIMAALSAPGFGIGSLILGGAFALGVAIFSLNLSRGLDARLEQLFDGFRDFSRALVAYLLMCLWVLLWTLLLIIPGIIAALSYAMTFYILADEKSITPSQALEKSKQMMNGYKWKLFRLMLWFLGFALLCVLTFGIGFLWFIPFAHITLAKFYDDIKAQPLNS